MSLRKRILISSNPYEGICYKRTSTEIQHSIKVKKTSLFPRGVMASPDGRFIFEAVRAAKVVLKIDYWWLDPGVCLRYNANKILLIRQALFSALLSFECIMKLLSFYVGTAYILVSSSTRPKFWGHYVRQRPAGSEEPRDAIHRNTTGSCHK